ncbi:hypothetical protein Tco_0474344 [Tanacetum coccineum]
MDLFNLISVPNPARVKTGTRQHAAHEVPLLTATASRVIDMEDVIATSSSSGTPAAIDKSPLDFLNEDPPPMITNQDETESQIPAETSREAPPVQDTTTTEVAPEVNLEREVTAMRPLVNKRHRKRDQSETEANAPPKVLRTDHAFVRPESHTRGGKSLAVMGLGAGSTVSTPILQETPADVIGPDPLSYARPQSSKGMAAVEDPESEKSTSFTSLAGSPGGIYQPGWGVTNDCRLDTPEACQDMVDHSVPPGYFSELRHLPNPEFFSQYNMTLARQMIQARDEEIKKLDEEVKSLRVVETEVHGLRNRTQNLETLLEAEVGMKKAAEAKNAELVSTLQSQITGEEKIKAAFEEFKRYEDDRVSSRCAKMDARLDALSIDFDEELYPHMLTAIAGRRRVTGHGLRLAVLKCAESIELRQAFANVVSAGITKGFCDGLKYGVELGEVKLDLANIEAYDPEAEDKFTETMQALKDLKYPLIDEIEKLKDAPMDIIMASLYFESYTGEDAPQWIRDLRPSSSQLKIPVYPEVRDPKDPWAFKEELLLKDVIAANDAASQTELPEDGASPGLVRSKSLPAMYNLDWP